MKKTISIIFILIGIFLLSSQMINEQLIKNKALKTQNIVEEVTAQEIEINQQVEVEYDYEAIEDNSLVSTLIGSIDIDNKNIIGQIIIEDLNMNLPILKGVTNSNLLLGAATMVDNTVMGEGNYSLAGHYMNDPSLLFGSLLDIQKDTIVIITDKKNIYEYQIFDTKLVPDTAFYMLDLERSEERGKPIISLMTCYYTSKNGKRFFALGELVNQYPFE